MGSSISVLNVTWEPRANFGIKSMPSSSMVLYSAVLWCPPYCKEKHLLDILLGKNPSQAGNLVTITLFYITTSPKDVDLAVHMTASLRRTTNAN